MINVTYKSLNWLTFIPLLCFYYTYSAESVGKPEFLANRTNVCVGVCACTKAGAGSTTKQEQMKECSYYLIRLYFSETQTKPFLT